MIGEDKVVNQNIYICTFELKIERCFEEQLCIPVLVGRSKQTEIAC